MRSGTTAYRCIGPTKGDGRDPAFRLTHGLPSGAEHERLGRPEDPSKTLLYGMPETTPALNPPRAFKTRLKSLSPTCILRSPNPSEKRPKYLVSPLIELSDVISDH